MGRKNNNYDDYDDYDDIGGFEKFKSHSDGRGKSKKHRRRQGEADAWAEIISKQDAELEDEIEDQPIRFPRATPVVQNSKPTFPDQSQFTFGPNTHEIKGVKIDLDGVSNIEKIDKEHNGMKTFGIKFFFKGNKGLYRIVWFSRYLKDRETTYEREYAFWKTLKG